MLKVAQKKGGEYSKTTKPYEYHHWIKRNDPPKFMSETDRRICRKMYFLEINDHYSSASKSSGSEVASLIEEIVSTGRARWDVYGGPELVMANGWSGRLSWQDELDGNQKLRLTGREGALLEVLPTEPLLAANPISGEAGPVDIDLPTDFVLSAVSGPSIAPAQASLISEAMAKAGVSKAVPLPTKLQRKSLSNLDPKPHLELVGVPGHMLTDRSGHFSRTKWVPGMVSVCRPSFKYGDYTALIYPTDDITISQGDEVLTIHRDIEQEKRFP